ncbi:von Willebrand factor type A (vWA) domain-containing protein [Candidatus Magnetoovum chiemensis]|nr:von Willebrand factor type A (vWA) domain-containing protein [Candidatus Magnetoovum chiemensis]
MVISLLILLSFIFVSCEDKTPPSSSKPLSNSQSSETSSSSSDVQNASKSQTVSNSNSSFDWPFIDIEDENSKQEIKESKERNDLNEISNNLTAKNFLLIFDGSGSMAEAECSGGRQKINVARDAVTEWSKNIPDDANLGVVAFYHRMWAELDLAPVNKQREKFSETITNLWASAGTPLTEAFKKAYIKITKQGKKQLGYGEYTIVVVTDGIADDSDSLLEYVNKILKESPVNIYTIGFCIGENHSLNQQGKTIYKSADNPEELKKGLNQVLAESQSFDDNAF